MGYMIYYWLLFVSYLSLAYLVECLDFDTTQPDPWTWIPTPIYNRKLED